MPKKRTLSDFLCRELLYDYATDNLDSERKQAVEECLKESEEVAADFEALKAGTSYCLELQKTELSLPYLERLKTPPKGMHDYWASWKKLPSPVRWGTESFVAACIAGLIVFMVPEKYLPWKSDPSVTLVEVDRIAPQESSTSDTTDSPPTTLLAENNVMYGPAPTTTSTTQVVAAAAVTVTTTTRLVAKVTTTTLAPVVVEAPSKVATKAKGEIYRVFMGSDQVDAITPQLVEKIVAIGGQKAGEVQLGWRRKQGSYFHFSMPEARFEELKQFFQTFGPVRIVRESHPRVMPQGTIRLILWVEESSSKSQSNGTTEPEQPKETLE